MRKFVIMAGVVALAVGSANCAGSGDNAGGLLGPTAASPAALAELSAMTEARGGGGGKPGGGGTTGGSGSLSVQMVEDVDHDGAMSHGDRVTFTVSTTATTLPQVAVTCSQGETVVFRTFTRYWDGDLPATQIMTLSSGAWTGGGAACTAELYYYSYSGTKNITLTTLNFAVVA